MRGGLWLGECLGVTVRPGGTRWLRLPLAPSSGNLEPRRGNVTRSWPRGSLLYRLSRQLRWVVTFSCFPEPQRERGKLSRERQIDLCALCHGGLGIAKKPAFSYTAGKDLKEYLHLEIPGPNERIDVHGNQVALLQKSRCYQASSMTCSTCHDVHLPQRDSAAFVERCLTCHKVQSCGLFPKNGDKIAGKCVDCHLPKLTSNVIVSKHEGARLQPQVRTHWIKEYPEIKQ